MILQKLEDCCSTFHLHSCGFAYSQQFSRYNKNSFNDWLRREVCRIKEFRHASSIGNRQIIYFTNFDWLDRIRLRTLGFKRIGSYINNDNDKVYIFLKSLPELPTR